MTPTQDTRDIIAAATRCLDAVWRDGHRYQKTEITLGDFYSQGVAQLSLFDDNAPQAVFYRAGDPAGLADEARNAFAAIPRGGQTCQLYGLTE